MFRHSPQFSQFNFHNCNIVKYVFITLLYIAFFHPLSAVASTYPEWLATHSLPADASGNGALLASPAGDGIPNLMKFALGLNPTQSGFQGRYSIGITSATVNATAQDFTTLTYQVPIPQPSGIDYIVEASSNLVSWTVGGVMTANSTVGANQTISIRDILAINASEPHRAMRLKINVSASVPSNSTTPLITGTAQVGQILTASTGTWSGGTDTPVYRYQWTRDGVDISGATSATYLVDAADTGSTLAVRITAQNIAGAASTLAAGVGPAIAASSFPSFEVRPDGYTANISFANLTTNGTYDLSPYTTPKVVLTVTSPGFDDTGSPTTVTRDILGTVALRQPYPNENTHTEVAITGGVKVTIALSDRIYSGDTVTQCSLLSGIYTSGNTTSPAATLTASSGLATNTSALPYPHPIANWLALPRERAVSGSTSFDLELLAFHRHPRNGRQVACVEFIATDEHAHTVSVKTSTMVQSTRVTTGNPIAVYRNSIPLASLTQGDLITVRTKVYPFLGDNTGVLDSDSSVDGVDLAAVPSGFANYTFLNDKTGAYGTIYAYVSPTGNDTTGVASTVDATAAASPCLTIYGAATKLKAANNSLYAHNDLGGGFIRLKAGTYSGFGTTSLNLLGAGRTWLTIEAAPGESPSTVNLTPGTRLNPGNWVKFKNITMLQIQNPTPSVIVANGGSLYLAENVTLTNSANITANATITLTGNAIKSIAITAGGNFSKGDALTMSGNTVGSGASLFWDGAIMPSVISSNDTGDGPPQIYGAYEGVQLQGISKYGLIGAAPMVLNIGLRYFIGCDMLDIGKSLNAPYSTSREHTPLLAGCTLTYTNQIASGGLSLPTWTNVGNIVSKGFYFCEAESTFGANGTTRVVAPKFGILAFNTEYGDLTTNSFGFKQPVGNGGGLAIVQNLLEMITNTSSPCFNVAADGAVKAMDNIVIQHMTVVGARSNFLYNDDGTGALADHGSKSTQKNGSLLYSLLYQYNCKTDTFFSPADGDLADGGRIGNWEVHHGVGQAGNVYETPAASMSVAFTGPYEGTNTWNNMYLGRNVKVKGTAAFISDLSGKGANIGFGSYKIGATSDARNRVPAGSATLPFDLDGTPRRNDGTGAAGAYEY